MRGSLSRSTPGRERVLGETQGEHDRCQLCSALFSRRAASARILGRSIDLSRSISCRKTPLFLQPLRGLSLAQRGWLTAGVALAWASRGDLELDDPPGARPFAAQRAPSASVRGIVDDAGSRRRAPPSLPPFRAPSSTQAARPTADVRPPSPRRRVVAAAARKNSATS